MGIYQKQGSEDGPATADFEPAETEAILEATIGPDDSRRTTKDSKVKRVAIRAAPDSACRASAVTGGCRRSWVGHREQDRAAFRLPPLGGEGRGGGRIVELTRHSPPSLTLPAEGREPERATPRTPLSEAALV